MTSSCSNSQVTGSQAHREAPVHPQVNGNQQNVFSKDVHLFGPAADSIITVAAQLRVKESVEGVDRWQTGILASFNQQVHVKIYNLE